jgi:hypothetical protein
LPFLINKNRKYSVSNATMQLLIVDPNLLASISSNQFYITVTAKKQYTGKHSPAEIQKCGC